MLSHLSIHSVQCHIFLICNENMRRYVSDELRGVVNFSVSENISLEFFSSRKGNIWWSKTNTAIPATRINLP